MEFGQHNRSFIHHQVAQDTADRGNASAHRNQRDSYLHYCINSVAMDIHRGFTLVELMITLALAAILMSIGIPSFQSYMELNRLAAQSNQMVQSLNLARSEAGKRGGNIAVAPIVAGNWAQGWQVWVDTNTNNAVDAGEEILLTVAAITGGSTLVSTRANYRYQRSGNVVAAGSFTLTASSGGVRTISIIATGRVSVTKS